MPTYVYRYPRRRYGRRYSSYRRRYSAYRRRRGRTSSTASSRGRIRVRVPVQAVISVPVQANQLDSSVVSSSPFLYATDVLPGAVCSAVATPLYRAYTNLYDQVKCDGVVSRLSIVSPIGSGANISALQVVMAYDRMGTANETLNTVALGADEVVTTAQLFNFSSATVVSAINNSVAKTSRSCWASDIQERSVFHDCSVEQTQTRVYDKDFYVDGRRVGFFAPLTLIGIRLSAAPSAATTIQVLLEQTYYMTFRNPKFGGSASASAANVQRIPLMAQVRDARSLDREADMRDVGGLDDEDAAAAPPAPQRQATQVLQHDGEDPDEYLSPALQG